jgi:hypothetical protein
MPRRKTVTHPMGGRKVKVDCVPCFDEFGSEACLRPAHERPWLTKEGRMEAAHAEFQKRIKKHWEMLDMFNEWTLDRDENGRYLNMSVSNAWDEWFAGWCSALRFVRIIK